VISVSAFRQGYLAGNSYQSDAPQNLIAGHFDVLVVVSSWDRRCLCITDCPDLTASTAIGVYFDVRDSSGLRDAHDKAVEQYCEMRGGLYEPIKGQSLDLPGMWGRIFGRISQARRAAGRPIRICMDLSTCPRYYSISVLSRCLGQGIAESVTMLYAEGRYPKLNEGPELALTGGKWATVPVPGLEGEYDPRKSRFYLISVGFEGMKTLRVTSKGDPERVSVLFPDPAVLPEYAEKTQRCNQDLFEQYRIPDEQVVRAPAGDAIGAWKALAEASLERPESEDAYYLCCGTKPHSIGLALHAMALGHPAVLYSVPEEHLVVNTQPIGVFWRFDVRDVCAVREFAE